MRAFRHLLYLERRPGGSTRGFSCALDLAVRHEASMTVAAVRNGDSSDWAGVLTSGGDVRKSVSDRRWRGWLDALASRASERGVPARVRLLQGRALDAVCQEVARKGQDLVIKVMESDRLLWPWRLDTTDRLLLRHCPAPVWLLHPAQGPGLGSVLAAVDVALDRPPELNRNILRTAASLAEQAGAELHVIHAWSLLGESSLASPVWSGRNGRTARLMALTRAARERQVKHLLEREGLTRLGSVAIRKGHPVREIRHAAWRTEADVVIVGCSGRSGMEALVFGNLSERLVGRVSASVLAVGCTSGTAPRLAGGQGTRRGRFGLPGTAVGRT